jgi:hypothetical protein
MRVGRAFLVGRPPSSVSSSHFLRTHLNRVTMRDDDVSSESRRARTGENALHDIQLLVQDKPAESWRSRGRSKRKCVLSMPITLVC